MYQVERHVDFTVDDLPLESSRDRGNLDTSVNTNNIINTILPFDTKNAVKWNASYLRGCTSEKRDLDVAQLQPRLADQLLSIARAQVEASVSRYDRGVRWEQEGLDVHGTRWVSMYLPVWLYSYHQPTHRRPAALHRRERPHRRDHGQRARSAVEAAARRADRGHVPRSHRAVDRGAQRHERRTAALPCLRLGPAGAAGLYWALYRYYRNTDKSHAFERETSGRSAKPVTGSDQ